MPNPERLLLRHMASLPCVEGIPTSTENGPFAYVVDSTGGPESGLDQDTTLPHGELVTAPSASRVESASIHDAVVVESAGPGGSDGAVSSKLRWKHWAVFLVGHLVSAAVIVAVISQLVGVCVVEDVGSGENLKEEEGQGGSGSNRNDHAQTTASSTHDTAFLALSFGLAAQVIFATVLSRAHASPLGLTSVHKIPPDSLSYWSERLNVYAWAPLSWAIIFVLGGTASLYLSLNPPCGGKGGSALEVYLEFSGVFMTIVGLCFAGISMLGVCFSLGSRGSETEERDTLGRSIITHNILSRCVFLDIVWRIQGVVWVYQKGGVGLTEFVILSVCSAVGVMLTAIGSVAPDIRHRPPGDRNVTTFANGV